MQKKGRYMSAYLRAWLAKQLRRKDVPDPVWGLLEEGGYIRDAIQESEQDDEENENGWQAWLVEQAQLFLKYVDKQPSAPAGRRRRQVEEQTYRSRLNNKEQAR